MRLTLGYSPCPNDTFIFGAMANGLIDTEGIDYEIVMDDVEALNKMAFAERLDVTKLSYHAFAHLTEVYRLLHAGSALGTNCGPLLVATASLDEAAVNQARIAIPGRMTTANFLLGLAYPQATNKTEVLFSDIEDAVGSGRFDAGLIIHENRFTYQQKGLVKIVDLGAFWETTTGLPIPLGGIVAKANLPGEIREVVDRTIRRSVEFAYANTSAVMPYIRAHAQAMEDRVMQAHIDLYVNQYSIDLGPDGRHAVQSMFEMARQRDLIPAYRSDFFR